MKTAIKKSPVRISSEADPDVYVEVTNIDDIEIDESDPVYLAFRDLYRSWGEESRIQNAKYKLNPEPVIHNQ